MCSLESAQRSNIFYTQHLHIQQSYLKSHSLSELKNTPSTTASPSRPTQQQPQPASHQHQPRSIHPTNHQHQPTQQVQQHNPMRQAAVHQPPPSYKEEPRQPNQPWQYSPNIDRLRQANRENMDHTFRSKTPNYYSNTGTFDRAAAGNSFMDNLPKVYYSLLVRQRSATPNILLPTGNQSRLPLQVARDTPQTPMADPFDFGPVGAQKPRPYSALPLTSNKRDFGAAPAPPTPKTERSPRDSYPPRIDPAVQPQKFRSKPPTPPPTSRRDRSASPATSPLFGKKPQIVLDSERKYQEKMGKLDLIVDL